MTDTKGEEILKDILAEQVRETNRYRTALSVVLEALQIGLANGVTIPDPNMGGTTDCFAISLDDIDTIRAAIAKILEEKPK